MSLGGVSARFSSFILYLSSNSFHRFPGSSRLRLPHPFYNSILSLITLAMFPQNGTLQKGSKPVTWMSLPKKPQLFILALCRLSEPLSNTCLLPYLYYLIRSLQPTPDTAPSSISRQAGLLVSLFALSQFATSVLWAHIADTYGRKLTILVGLFMSIIANIGFGFSTSIRAVMFWRIVAGLGNGNIGVMRTMTAEMYAHAPAFRLPY